MTSRTMGARGTLLASVSIAVLAGIAAQGEARAACSPDPVSAGGSVTCSGTDSDGFSTKEQKVSVTVQEGATVDAAPGNTPSLSVLGFGSSVTNDGDIYYNEADAAAVGHAVHIGAITLVNNGLIESRAQSDGAMAIEADGNAMIENTGSIVVDTTGQGHAIFTQSDVIIINDGLISFSGLAGAAILGQHGSMIANSGTVTLETTGGFTSIAIAGSRIDNEGTVSVSSSGDDANSVGLYLNQGEITLLNNSGDIKVVATGDGTLAAGVHIGVGASLGTINNSGSIIVEAKSADSEVYGIEVTANDVVVVNTDEITVTSAAENPDVYGIHVYSSFIGSKITNGAKGSITSSGIGVYLPTFGTFTNDGTIDSQLVGVVGGSDATIANNGSIISDLDGIASVEPEFGNLGSIVITNDGKVDAGRDGMRIDMSGTNVTNKGAIKAGGVGINSTDLDNDTLGGNSFIRNIGSIDAEGVAVQTGAGSDIENSGTMDGQVGIVSEHSTMILNTGAITATETGLILGGSSRVFSSGAIDAGFTGIVAEGNSSITVEPGGTITVGKGGTAVRLGNGSSVLNSGTITSGGDGIVMSQFFTFNNEGTVTAVGDALRLENGTPASNTILNSGTLKGETSFRGTDQPEDLLNAGLLHGNVTLAGGDDHLQLNDGQIDGTLDAGDGNDKLTSTVLSGIDGKVIGLEQLVVESGTLTAALDEGSVIGGTVVKDGAAMAFSGSLTGDVKTLEGGTFDGNGAISGGVTNAGSIGPGNSIGTLDINGDYTQAATGQLFVELGATSADKLAVTGKATLDGVLSTGLVAQDLLTLEGKSYTVLTAGGIGGEFDTTGTVKQGFWTLDVQQTGTAVTVTVTDVNLTVGASAPFTGSLANAIAAAAAGSQEPGGVVITNRGLPPLGGVITGTNDPVPSTQQSTSLDYDSLGDWEATAPTFVAGWSDMGARTPAAAMPKTGSGTFEGTTKGELTETGAPEAFVVEGNVMLTANFASGLVNADFTEMEKVDAKGVASAWVDFRARMSIADGTSEFAGTAGTDDGVWSGKARGGFYGDEGGMPGHAAGLWSMSSPLGRALGGFTAKRQ